MSGNVTLKTFSVHTAADGSWSQEYAVRGTLLGVQVEIGDLSTPDIEITDEPSGDNLLTVAGVAGDAKYYPDVASTDPDDGTPGDTFFHPGIFGKVKVAVAGGGNSKFGYVRLLIAR